VVSLIREMRGPCQMRKPTSMKPEMVYFLSLRVRGRNLIRRG